ncbi:MAG: hypothetical protein ABFC84_17930 [Veillonellales bacterium]
MSQKYYVTLSEDERKELKKIIKEGKTQGYKIKHAQILLKLDEIPENKGWTNKKIEQTYDACRCSVIQIAKRYVEEGLESALGRKSQKNRAHKFDGEIEAKIIALTCTAPPEGHERWTILFRPKMTTSKLVFQI